MVLLTLELELDVFELVTVAEAVAVFIRLCDIADVLVKLGDDEDVFDSRIVCVEDGVAEFVLEIIVERLTNGLLLEVFEELAEELEVLDAVELLEVVVEEVWVFDNGAVMVAGSVADAVFVFIAERVS